MFSSIVSRSVIVLASVSAIAFSQPATDQNNLVSNGDFSDGETGWTYFVKTVHGTEGTSKVVDGQMVCDVTKANGYWDVQMYHSKVSLEKDVTYVLTFDAKADKDRTIVSAVESDNGQTEYNPTGGGKNQINLTTTMKTTTLTFTMTKPTDNNARVNFNIGASISKVYLDNVSLIDKTKITGVHPQSAALSESSNSRVITPDSKGISFQFSNPANCGFQIYSLSGKFVANSNTRSHGSAEHYRIDYRSLGLSYGMYMAQAHDGNLRYSKLVTVLP
jgi:hypothetical protein